MNPSPWFCLEAIPGLVALETDWQSMVGEEQFAGFSSLCLEPSSWHVQRFRCPRRCGCNHWVIPRHDGTGAVAVCRCASPVCPDISLTLREITPLEVNYLRLGHGLCNAFGFAAKHADLLPPNTFQFGSWSSDAVPAILTIQVQNSAFRRAVAELAAQLRQPFILFTPTSDFVDAPSKAILESYGAACFGLDSHVLLTRHGTLQPTRLPGELFARFSPQPREIDLDAARRVFGLVRNLDTDKPLRPPTLLAVFRHYCIEELSASNIARKYRCSKPTILRRLNLIRVRTGMDPRQLRRLSPHIARIEDSLHDPRARRIRPASGLEQEEDSD